MFVFFRAPPRRSTFDEEDAAKVIAEFLRLVHHLGRDQHIYHLKEPELTSFTNRLNLSLNKIQLDMDSEEHAIAESKRVAKLLWKKTLELEDERVACEEDFKSYAETHLAVNLEIEANEEFDAAKREQAK